MKKVKKIVIYAVIVIAVIGAIVAKNKMTSNAKNASVPVAVTKTAVDVQNVKSVEKNKGNTYKATLEARTQATITGKVSGKVSSVSFENGQYVNAGDTLIRLDDQDVQNELKTAQAQLKVTEQSLATAQASLVKLKLNLDDAKRNYDRQKDLYEKGAIPKTDFEAAEKTLNSAQADYDSGNVSIETSKANIEAQNVNISNIQDKLNNLNIKAPISGVISSRSVNIGQIASPGTALAIINDISSVYATIQIPQDKINDVKIGQAASVTTEGSDTVYDGTVKTIDLSADPSARVFNCKIEIDNSNKSLYPGIFAKVNVINGEKIKAMTVPINALVGNEGDYSVFINVNGKAKKQKVTIGETDENNVEITDGIKDGYEIICSNISTLQDGTEIEKASNQENNSAETTSQQNGDSVEAVSK